MLEAVSGRIVHVGDSGAGQIVKAANQLVVGSTIQAVAEALVLATAAGVDPVRVREALLGGYAASRILEVHGQRMIEGNFTPGARAVLYRKDLGIIQGLARSLGVPTPAFDAVAEGFERLVAEGGGDRDYSALVTLLEEAAGVRVAGTQRRRRRRHDRDGGAHRDRLRERRVRAGRRGGRVRVRPRPALRRRRVRHDVRHLRLHLQAARAPRAVPAVAARGAPGAHRSRSPTCRT